MAYARGPFAKKGSIAAMNRQKINVVIYFLSN